MKHYSDEPHINVGTGEDLKITDVARMIAETVGFQGDLRFDPSKPDGTPRKVTDVSRLSALGWRAQTSLKDGLATAYQWYCEQAKTLDRQPFNY